MSGGDGFAAFILGVVTTITILFSQCDAVTTEYFITMYSDKPYCETHRIAGKRFRRCVKVIEVEPESSKELAPK